MDINALNTTDISEKGVVIEIVDESGLSDGTTVTMRGVDSEVWQRHQSKITGYRNIENMHGRVPDDKKIEGMLLDAVVDCAMDWSGWTNGADENGKPVPDPIVYKDRISFHDDISQIKRVFTVTRGGSWWCSEKTCNGFGLNYRGKILEDTVFSNNGFRCAKRMN